MRIDNIMAAGEANVPKPRQEKQYDYLLKFLLVGDSDVGKQEILSGLDDGAAESPFCSGSAYKTTTILLDGKRVKLQLWDTSGQGRFCTIIRSYSRGAQGILLVYDITNKWSFDGIDRWLKEVEEHAPGVPKVLVGNRLHLAFKRQVWERDAEIYAAKNRMAFFEVSPLCDFNIRESFSELSRMALHRNGMERLWRSNKVLSLQELACRAIVARTTVYGIDQLPLPSSIKSHLKSYAMTTTSQPRYNGNRPMCPRASLSSHHRRLRFVKTNYNGLSTPGSSPGSITDSRTNCVGRNSCSIS
ncbi:ras-related protein Rab-40B isoform X2 [Belonocnema kinseyi]|uniref:ras-related protein Rab-40B isoform X2 n=1 Tax=Belonocnema kinseyi TaxID=2817044 RepID=UPI00143DB084|nr:ras-related protein Rab-40B isoform X2 [Belonocnema kinseyi]